MSKYNIISDNIDIRNVNTKFIINLIAKFTGDWPMLDQMTSYGAGAYWISAFIILFLILLLLFYGFYGF